MRKVTTYLAQPIGDRKPEPFTIEASEAFPDVQMMENMSGDDFLEECHRRHHEQASKIAEVLFTSLPGGTIDALLGEFLRRRASLFSVPLGK